MKEIEKRSIDTIRILSADAVEKANSGHPGLPMGAASMAYVLWQRVMKHHPKETEWIDRDRFVLSAGHGSMLIYSLLHLSGYGLSMNELKRFRQLDSKTPGHPEYGHTQGVETTTGPLGQGIGNVVGMAMAERYLAEKFNKEDCNIIDHYTFALAGDGCMMEGISSEAASLAGTLKLGKLIVLYDDNGITIEGKTDLAFSEDVKARYESYGWQVLEVCDDDDLDAIEYAIKFAKRTLNKPSLIKIKTKIGHGAGDKEGTAGVHGSPLGEKHLSEARANFEFENQPPFKVQPYVYNHFGEIGKRGARDYQTWEERVFYYRKHYKDDFKKLQGWISGKIEIDLSDESLWKFKESMATRAASGQVLNMLKEKVENLIGGSADLAPSTKTNLDKYGAFSASQSGDNIHFGVREHAMASIINGISLHGGLKAYGATFLVFSDYMKGAMRLSAIMERPVIYVLTHDSIGVGEDGPTHQPIEHLASLRSIPNLVVFRPADAKETLLGWKLALESEKNPYALILSRQNLPTLDETSENSCKGGYILKESNQNPEIIIIATGSEISIAYDVYDELVKREKKVRIVSMPSFELFDKQEIDYKESILPNEVRKRISIEAASTFGWQKYTGIDGINIGIDTFGASAPSKELYNKFGIESNQIVKEIEKKGWI